MNNVLNFPDKVFLQWEAVAQVLAPYLKHLGATKDEAKKIIGRLEGQWEQPAVALDKQAWQLILCSLPGAQHKPNKQELLNQGAPAAQGWKFANVRTLLELARVEFHTSQSA